MCDAETRKNMVIGSIQVMNDVEVFLGAALYMAAITARYPENGKLDEILDAIRQHGNHIIKAGLPEREAMKEVWEIKEKAEEEIYGKEKGT